MFEIGFNQDGDVVLTGRLDAAQAPAAQAFLDGVARGTVAEALRTAYGIDGADALEPLWLAWLVDGQ